MSITFQCAIPFKNSVVASSDDPIGLVECKTSLLDCVKDWVDIGFVSLLVVTVC